MTARRLRCITARFTEVINGFRLRTDSSLTVRDSSFSMGDPDVMESFTQLSTAGISGSEASLDVDRCTFGPFVGGRGISPSSGNGGVGRPAYGIQMEDYLDIRVTNSVFRDITGGRGGNGGNGANGASGSSPGESGEDGETGGEGGMGGTAYAFSATNQLNPFRPLSGEVVFAQNLVLRINGGRGGDGGMGGIGGGGGANGARGSDGGPFTCGNNGGHGGNGGDAADLAEPLGLWDLADIVGFVTAFNGGCP